MATGPNAANEASTDDARPEHRHQQDNSHFRSSTESHQIHTMDSSSLEKDADKTEVASEAPTRNVQTERRHKKDYFPFMELPSELRLEIYRMALSRPKPILLHMPRPSEKEQNQGDYQWETEETPESGLPDDRASNNTNANTNNDADGLLLQPRRGVPDRRSESRRQLPTGDNGINTDPLVPALLRVSQLIYRESRPVLYSDNELVLHLPSALCTLSQLHQRSRSLIKHVRLAIPTHHDILEGFADLVRLGLRYCWGLKTFTISLPDMFPEERHVPSSTTNVYANAFHILRWLPKNTLVQLEGNVHEEIRKVVEENGQLSKKLNEKEYLRRQHQMPDRR
ncbi:uncharacterized protein LTHEOB_11959 [Lasiodiplodia theobromae]|uniref:2EXR domain-containing protein n=1 Tax=Lasiodiplodia theobromae TaxID=45133 RepID=A0A5N5DC78_9PEZI|nr:uncharacterized protein LTHEOB_11959 [Lasiodiplodia theobromae]KAB2575453.1 hypothetical protein DBV05_g5957 [Lasiodiplodia theobromae]KAF4536827.1 hypothetical protein LTHEOB_11959 [Lasiodiplodia theobromae]